MTFHTFLGMEIGVPEPEKLAGFYQDYGLISASSSGDVWGTKDMPKQVKIVERSFRQLVTMRIGCDSEEDIQAVAKRLEGIGVSSELSAGRLHVRHPGHGWGVSVEVSEREKLSAPSQREFNGPGNRARTGRAEATIEVTARPPRRIGHVVLGSPDPVKTTKFFTEGIGMYVSDVVGDMASFMRCSSDHHNLLIQPGAVPYLNHYAFEFDDIDAVGVAAANYLEGKSEDHDVLGIGRHTIGSNIFHYMMDPCGNMFENFCDMDNIEDPDEWEVRTDWTRGEFTNWGPGEKDVPEVFFTPSDITEIAKAFQEAKF